MNARPRELVSAVWALVGIQLLDSAYTVGAPMAQGDLAQSDVVEAIGGAILWLGAAYLIYTGRGWVRYVYTIVFLAAVAFLVYFKVTDWALLAMTVLPAIPITLWFMPASNRWFSGLKQSGS